MNGNSVNTGAGKWWDLPPLILHPFDRGLEATASLDSIRLSLYLNGMGEPDADKERLIRGRYAEFRMLCLIGKDVMRWIEQCEDFAHRDAELAQAGIRRQSFADFLVNSTPVQVGKRFESWGVRDYRRILTRAIGINSVFPVPPSQSTVSQGFVEEYCTYADNLFTCFQSLEPFRRLDPASFGVALYTSDEYLGTLRYGLDENQV